MGLFKAIMKASLHGAAMAASSAVVRRRRLESERYLEQQSKINKPKQSNKIVDYAKAFVNPDKSFEDIRKERESGNFNSYRELLEFNDRNAGVQASDDAEMRARRIFMLSMMGTPLQEDVSKADFVKRYDRMQNQTFDSVNTLVVGAQWAVHNARLDDYIFEHPKIGFKNAQQRYDLTMPYKEDFAALDKFIHDEFDGIDLKEHPMTMADVYQKAVADPQVFNGISDCVPVEADDMQHGLREAYNYASKHNYKRDLDTLLKSQEFENDRLLTDEKYQDMPRATYAQKHAHEVEKSEVAPDKESGINSTPDEEVSVDDLDEKLDEQGRIGAQMALYVEEMRPFKHVDDEGNERCDVLINAFKRPDIDGEHNQYDGQSVIENTTQNYQAVSIDAANRILEVNGKEPKSVAEYEDMADHDLMMSDKQYHVVATMRANVYQDDYGNYVINSKPEKINASDEVLDMNMINQKRRELSTPKDVETNETQPTTQSETELEP